MKQKKFKIYGKKNSFASVIIFQKKTPWFYLVAEKKKKIRKKSQYLRNEIIWGGYILKIDSFHGT